MQSLTKAEEQIMHIIWEKEKCLIRDIIEDLGNPEMPHSTVSSVVRILEKKGFVSHKAYGKTYEYFPIVAKEDYTKTGLKDWIGNYFNGSPSQLVSFLVEKKELKLKDLNELMQQLESLKK
ncbi:BlaI/MecI/CopY family transcriptional regulator [Taibaiella lutea]|uniref:BlaI/MecI/CopY family transcriptional regulator n=1 Tax=Taibaiella lutea TaxID=2608001 RepID=A0A5M6CQC2_9BACT|nr:BlaI/MecI/CopY family transcriptional regulator [Taibaiella lutea]KAA5537481.1 BlaI/MecI/CopY family transcriptional regulator [Taibaiella lutea]